MLGAIIGDIAGSIYEFNNIKTENFTPFEGKCFFTDDTVMTIAVADALMNGKRHEKIRESIPRRRIWRSFFSMASKSRPKAV